MAVLSQLKMLINLAFIDGEVTEKERKYITTIGLVNGVPLEEITPLFDQRHEILLPANLSGPERFEYIFSLVQLMKIDERIYQEEIRFCSLVASRLGYDPQVMFDLMLHVRAVMKDNELDELRELTAKYLKMS